MQGLDEPNPWYTTASPFGGPVAPVIVYQQADQRVQGLVPRQPLRQPVAPSGMGDPWADTRWTGSALQRAGGRSLPIGAIARSSRREMWVRDEVRAPDRRAAVHHQSFLAEQNQRRGHVARSGEQGRHAATGGAVRGAAARSSSARRSPKRCATSSFYRKPELSQRQVRLEGARLSGIRLIGGPHDALVASPSF